MKKTILLGLAALVTSSFVGPSAWALDCTNLEPISFNHNYEGCKFKPAEFGTFTEDRAGLTLVLNCYKTSESWFSGKQTELEPIEKSVDRQGPSGGLSHWNGEDDTYFTRIDTDGDTITLSTWIHGDFGREESRTSTFRCLND